MLMGWKYRKPGIFAWRTGCAVAILGVIQIFLTSDPLLIVNEIYPFEQRDAIFRDLNPMKIISFDSIDEEGRVQRGTYTSYVFTNPRENRGYFIISEPYRGDKSCRGVYLSDKFVEDLNGGEENSNFWVDITRIYLEMSGQEFHDEPSTYTFRHRALEQYAARMKYIISGEIDPNVSKSVIYTAKMNLSKLFGIEMNKQKLSEDNGPNAIPTQNN